MELIPGTTPGRNLKTPESNDLVSESHFADDDEAAEHFYAARGKAKTIPVTKTAARPSSDACQLLFVIDLKRLLQQPAEGLLRSL